MLAEIKATVAEDRSAKELHRTILPLLSLYSCTWSNPLWSLPFCYNFDCAHFEKQHNTPMAHFFQVFSITTIRGDTSESSTSFLGFIGAFHVIHRVEIVNSSGKSSCNPCSQGLRFAHIQDKHQHKQLQVWIKPGICHREFSDFL